MASISATTSSSFNISNLKGWVPVDAVVRNGRPGMVWMDMRDVELREPFFHQTVERIRREKNAPERFTDLDALLQFEKGEPGILPTGFIFHSSRCGSTVISNAFKALSNTFVVSEAFAVDKLIGRFLTDVGESDTRRLIYSVFLRATVNALAQARLKDQNRYFIKYSSLSVLQLASIKRIWPNVPWAFIYRDPVEVIVSNLQTPPEWMQIETNSRMAAAVLGIREDAVTLMSREEYCARVVGTLYAVAVQSMDEQTRLLNYNELALSSVLALAAFFGREPGAEEVEAIEQSMRLYAKDEELARPYLRDREQKRDQASVLVNEMAEKWAQGPYQQLEQRRLQQKDYNK